MIVDNNNNNDDSDITMIMILTAKVLIVCIIQILKVGHGEKDGKRERERKIDIIMLNHFDVTLYMYICKCNLRTVVYKFVPRRYYVSNYFWLMEDHVSGISALPFMRDSRSRTEI